MLFIARWKNHVNMRNDNLLNVKHSSALNVKRYRWEAPLSIYPPPSVPYENNVTIIRKLNQAKVFLRRLRMFIEN